MWIPDLSFILNTFELMKQIPECNDLIKARCISQHGIMGILDKVEFGIPFQENNFFDQAAILCNDLILYHFFSDGNKRIGFLMLVVFLKKNGYILLASDDEKVNFALNIAQSKLNHKEIKSWIEKKVKKND